MGLGSPCPGCKDDLGWVGIAAVHEGPLQQAIHALKYDDRVELGPSLGRYLRAVTAAAPWPAILRSLDGIVPVPLHKDRLLERGYNQSKLLAEGLAVGCAALVFDNAIERYKATRSHVCLSPPERADNVTGKFRADTVLETGTSLLLVDDVFTTGATMRACASALREAGADAVFGLALARPDTS
ncbi:MAG: ComF family protein [Caldilineaceae bacterium SB0675_bin_29]|uniref:ComF family protein n=1 Tax=Caldilineaceae bacterium SB0675_bin_29 TaxID=2605266 RepID=A0A6B1FYY1_9CHLR|nr:ComF family protein [Caldilineaceae bacterium SB0675_bin_29]